MRGQPRLFDVKLSKIWLSARPHISKVKPPSRLGLALSMEGSREATLAVGVCCAALSFAAAVPTSASAQASNAWQQTERQRLPLVLKEQGTFYVGGTIELRNPNASTTATLPGDGTAPGHIHVNQMYVEYQIPAILKSKYPIVFMHGRGHTGSFFRSTPDGRDGWFTSFTRRGFAVYAVDGANRGRGGWDPTKRFAASQGLEPPSSMEEANIYTEESAWTSFRWGPTFGAFYANTQFPKAYVNDYLNLIQAAYRNEAPPAPQIQNDLIAADLGALIDRIGPCILLGWSTGGGNVLSAATSTPQRIKNVRGLIGIEGFPGSAGNNPDPALVAKIPVLAIEGDNLSPAATRAYTATLVSLGGDAKTIFLPDIGLFGNGHTMAVELNNEKIADVMEQWIKQHVK